MRNKATYILIVLFTLIVQSAISQIRNADSMVHRIFHVIKWKDENGFVKLFPDKAGMIKLMTAMAKEETNVPISSSGMEEMLKQITQALLDSQFSDMFKEVLVTVNNSGVNWKNANITSYIIDSNHKSKQLSGKIYFRSDEKDYFMEYDEVMWLEGNWYGVTISRIDEKANEPKEKQKTDFYDFRLTDSLMRIDSIYFTDTMVYIKPEMDSIQTRKKEKSKKSDTKPTDKKSSKPKSPAKKED